MSILLHLALRMPVVRRLTLFTSLVACLQLFGAPAARAQDETILRQVPISSNAGTVVLLGSGRAWYLARQDALPQLVYGGPLQLLNAVPVDGGIVSLFSDGSATFSPNGLDLGGGGLTVTAKVGRQSVVSIAAVNGGVVALMSGGGAYFSPNGRHLDGGGATQKAYGGSQRVVSIMEVTGGLTTRFSEGGIYFSPNGLNLGGGGSTQRTPVWNRVAEASAFGGRDSARLVAHGDRLLLASGFYRSPAWSYSDIWDSSDSGESWQLQAGVPQPLAAAWDGLFEPYSPIVSRGSELLAIGRAVWRSADGRDWQLASANGPVRATEDTFVFDFKGRLILVHTQYGRIYSSHDGLNWEFNLVIPNMPTRCGAAVTATRGKLWIMGGASCDYRTFYDDIWSSEDGTYWERATQAGEFAVLPWGARMWPAICSDGNLLFAFGGFRIDSDARTNLNDSWSSRDGVRWSQMSPLASKATGSPAARHAAACVVQSQKNRVLLIAGKGGADGNNDRARVLNDVWALELALMPRDP